MTNSSNGGISQANLPADDAIIFLRESTDLQTYSDVEKYELDERDNYNNGSIKTTLQSNIPITTQSKSSMGMVTP